MKRILTFVVIIVLTSCDINISPKSINATTIIPAETGYNFQLQYDKYNVNGMDYGIFYSSMGISVVNLTKDALEVEKLKLEIEEIKRQSFY